MEKIILKNIFDLHAHLREGPMLAQVLPFTAKFFSVAVAMPNLLHPVKTARDILRYRKEIDSYNQENFEPLMGIMLTPETTSEVVAEAYHAGAKFLKNIPAGVSTNACGVPLSEMRQVYSALKTASDLGMPLLIHAEVPVEITSYQSWIERINRAIPFLQNLIYDLPGLIVVVEHANTAKLIDFIQRAPGNVKGTLTCHHQLLTWKDVVDENGRPLDPLNFCFPLPGTEDDRLAVLWAAINDHENFGFGSDSAPHYFSAKRRNPPPGGIFSGPVAIQKEAEIFAKENRLEELQSFFSPLWAKNCYEFEPTQKTITLVKKIWTPPFDYEGIPIFQGGKEISWSIE